MPVSVPFLQSFTRTGGFNETLWSVSFKAYFNDTRWVTSGLLLGDDDTLPLSPQTLRSAVCCWPYSSRLWSSSTAHSEDRIALHIITVTHLLPRIHLHKRHTESADRKQNHNALLPYYCTRTEESCHPSGTTIDLTTSYSRHHHLHHERNEKR